MTTITRWAGPLIAVALVALILALLFLAGAHGAHPIASTHYHN